MNKKYIVRLTSEERKDLEKSVSKGRRAAYKIKHANILLKADADGPGWSDDAIAEAFSVHEHTVRNVRERFVEHGMKAALERKKQDAPSRKPILDGEKQARLLAIGCSQPPQGHARWTLELLAQAHLLQLWGVLKNWVLANEGLTEKSASFRGKCSVIK